MKISVANHTANAFTRLFTVSKQKKNFAWERREKTESLLKKFMTEGLQVNPDEIAIADLCKLLQQPTYQNQKKIDRSIMFELTTSTDKHKIMLSLKKNKNCNSDCKQKNQTAPPVYVTEHLLKQFLKQKKSPIPCSKKLMHKKRNPLGH